jgi:hypothetical protein
MNGKNAAAAVATFDLNKVLLHVLNKRSFFGFEAKAQVKLVLRLVAFFRFFLSFSASLFSTITFYH